MRLILIALLLLALPGAAFAQSSPAEQTMMRTVEAEHDRHVALLETLVNQNSGTLNLAGVRIVGDRVRLSDSFKSPGVFCPRLAARLST